MREHSGGHHKTHAQIASHTPGRLRVRVHPSHRDPDALQEVASRLEDQPGIQHVDVNANTGSVLVHYDRETHEKDEVVGCLEDVGLLLGSILEAGGEEIPDLEGSESESGSGSSHSTTAAGVVDTVNDLDRRLSELTGRKVDLRLLFPVALGAIGVRAAITNGIGFAEVPAYILIWYAFDAFWKFHQRPHAGTAGGNGSSNSTPSG
ncbi:MAG: hypothetical protein JO057_21980 [Chloroflexi bacterium]|nr:hypothetical protein [Chloroflexota bacterium]